VILLHISELFLSVYFFTPGPPLTTDDDVIGDIAHDDKEMTLTTTTVDF